MEKWKVLLTARAMSEVGGPAVEVLKAAGCECKFSDRFGPLKTEELLARIESFDAVLASSDKYSAEFFASPVTQSLKIISRWGVGFDSIDLAASTKAGVVVGYTPGMLNDSVADYTLALILALARRVHIAHNDMREGRWVAAWGRDLTNKTLGIVGCGRIGLAVAKRAAGFDMRLVSFDVCRNPEGEKLGVNFVSMDELLEQSDFVSVHAALTPQTRGLIGEAQLRKMKPGAYLINTARGAHIDDAALVRALNEGWIAGAALDTFTTEPLPLDNPLRSAKNLLITPHQASLSHESGEQVSRAAAQAIVDLMNGKRPKSVVDPSVFESPTLRAKLI